MLLAGDVGGTKTLLGLFAPTPERPHPSVVREFATLAFPNLGDSALLATGHDSTRSPVEHFVAAVKLADGTDLWYEKLPAPAVKGGTAVDHAGRLFVVLDDGRVLYTRWDYTNRHANHFQCPWVSRPDGTGTANVYGNLTRNPIITGEPRPVPGSHEIVCTATAQHGYTAGSLVLVDSRQGLDGLAPLTRITPEIAFPETEGWPTGA